jgi:uncharacterized membrane protein
MTDLEKLIAAVEAGDSRFSSYLPSGHERAWPQFYKAMDGSLDAALALFNALLPGVGFYLWDAPETGKCGCKIGWSAPSHAPTPARALLLATLRAYASTTPQEQP